jgi:uncharacterized protein (TIGR02271 family)
VLEGDTGMTSYSSVLPGARVRTAQGFIGTVERLEHHWADSTEQPDRMIVRSDDGRWRYSIPVMFISTIEQGAFSPIVQLRLDPDELTHYVAGALPGTPHASRSDMAARPPTSEEEPTLRVPLAIEELVVRKEPLLLGKVHVHKGVEAVEQRTQVPVYHEEAVVEHIPPEQYDGGAPNDPNEVIVPVIEERLVVRKERVVTEYIRIRKALVAKPYEVYGTVRREVVDLHEEREDGVMPEVSQLIHYIPEERLEGPGDTTDMPSAEAQPADH